MRSIWMIARKGILKRKTYAVAILFLALVAAACMITAFSTIFRTRQIYDTAYRRAHSPDIFYLFKENAFDSGALPFFQNRPEVKSAVAQHILIGDGTVGALNGHDLNSSIFEAYDPAQNDFALAKGSRALDDGSVYLPLIYQSEFGARIGGRITFRGTGGDMRYTIAGFFEDPVFGSAFMGMKRILFTDSAYRQIEAGTVNYTTIKGVTLNVYLKPAYQGNRFEKAAEAVNRASGRDTLALFQTDKQLFSTSVLIIPRIISVVLLCFSVLLVLIILLVLRHAILSSVEADYLTYGILKAEGFTGGGLLFSILLQYLILVGCGAAAGMALAFFATPALSGMLMSSTGILATAKMTLPAALGVPPALLLLCGGIAGLTARRAAAVSPMRAIAYGRAPVQFSSWCNPSLSRLRGLPLWLRLPLKQITTRFRQYVTLTVVAALFTFMLVTLQMLTASFGSVRQMARLLGQPLYDLDVISVSPTLCPPAKLDDIVRDIDAAYGVRSTGWTEFESLRIDGNAITGSVWDSFGEQQDSVLSGKLPQFGNEVAVTPLVSRLIGKGVGDTVVVQKGDVKQTYLITCVLQSINEMGKLIEMNSDGYRRLVPDFQPMSRSLVLQNDRNVPGVISALKEKYPADSGVAFTDDKTSLYNVFATVQAATGMASAIVLFLTLLLIACITLLLCTITLNRETTDTGIFKAVGFRTGGLRLQFTLRFALVSLVGGAAGIALSLLFSGPLIGAALSGIGVSNIPSAWGFLTLGFPVLFVLGVAALTSLLCSARIRRITPVSLMGE